MGFIDNLVNKFRWSKGVDMDIQLYYPGLNGKIIEVDLKGNGRHKNQPRGRGFEQNLAEKIYFDQLAVTNRILSDPVAIREASRKIGLTDNSESSTGGITYL